MTTFVNRTVSDTEAGKALTESLSFENANSEFKKAIMPLKARPAPIDERIRNTADIGTHSYDIKIIGEVISKDFEKMTNSSNQSHFERNYMQRQSDSERRPKPSGR